MEIFEAAVFALHFFFFGITALFFFLKFHKKAKLKPVFFSAMAVWILLGTTDFVLGLIDVISMFQ